MSQSQTRIRNNLRNLLPGCSPCSRPWTRSSNAEVPSAPLCLGSCAKAACGPPLSTRVVVRLLDEHRDVRQCRVQRLIERSPEAAKWSTDWCDQRQSISKGTRREPRQSEHGHERLPALRKTLDSWKFDHGGSLPPPLCSRAALRQLVAEPGRFTRSDSAQILLGCRGHSVGRPTTEAARSPVRRPAVLCK